MKSLPTSQLLFVGILPQNLCYRPNIYIWLLCCTKSTIQVFFWKLIIICQYMLQAEVTVDVIFFVRENKNKLFTKIKFKEALVLRDEEGINIYNLKNLVISNCISFTIFRIKIKLKSKRTQYYARSCYNLYVSRNMS